jgi:hypothetical protein
MQIDGINDFLGVCLRLKKAAKKGCKLFFRGEPEIFPSLLPTIYVPKYNFIENEDKIFREIVSRFPEEMLAQKTTAEKLILMRHYELPTRILDISSNPLVSLFFSCYRGIGQSIDNHKDGRVYVFSVPEKEIKHCDSDAASIAANLCKRPIDFSVRGMSRMSRDELNKQEPIQYLVHDIQEEKPHFKNLVLYKDINSVKCLYPRMNNPRVIRQAGYFFLYGINIEKKSPAVMDPSWRVDDILISHKIKKQIVEELSFLNITEPYLFPDYERLANYMRQDYEKKYSK